MEESYETFEEELGPPRADPPPQKPVRQIRRPEMYTPRKAREEVAAVPQQPRVEPRTAPKEPSIPRSASLQKALSIQNLCQIETPWENVTLNRCLFVAITILVLTSGFQRLHETLRGQRVEEEEDDVGLTVRRPVSLRHRGHPPEPEQSLWDVMFWWLPDLDDEDDDEEDEDEDDGVKRAKPKKGAATRGLRGLRNMPLPDKKLMKRREGKLKERRAKKGRDEEIRDEKERDKTEEPEDAEDEEEGNEEAVPKKSKKIEGQKKKKTQKG